MGKWISVFFRKIRVVTQNALNFCESSEGHYHPTENRSLNGSAISVSNEFVQDKASLTNLNHCNSIFKVLWSSLKFFEVLATNCSKLATVRSSNLEPLIYRSKVNKRSLFEFQMTNSLNKLKWLDLNASLDKMSVRQNLVFSICTSQTWFGRELSLEF